MEKIAVFYFSGTGNTELISESISDGFATGQTELIRIEDIINNVTHLDLASYGIIGIGFPSYGFNAPRIVEDFIKQLPHVSDMKCFIFLTCAGPCYLNDVASFGIKKNLVRKGFDVIYEKTICMPANILLHYDIEMVKRIYDTAMKKVEIMTSDISNNIRKIRKDRFIPYLFRWLLVLIERVSIKTVPMDFHMGKECNRCMVCVKRCPRHNIRIKKDTMTFGLNCEACYRCVYSCPQRAIKGRLYNPAILKEGYNIKQKIHDCKMVEVKTPLKGIYKTMKSYFESVD